MTERYDITGIGNAIVDVIAQVGDDFIQNKDLPKGGMTLVDETQADALYQELGPAIERSGGSAGNTMAGVASLGGRGAYIGKVKDDQLGEVFGHDIRSGGIDFRTPAATEGPETARCLVMVTPDAQRTMCTYLGACVGLGPDDVDPDLIESSRVTYLEGYLWDRPEAKQAFVRAAEIAHGKGRQVSLTLSDPFCVDRHRESFKELVAGHIDILFANEAEILSLYQVERFEDALEAVKPHCKTVALTRSEKGSVILHGGQAFEVPAERVDKVVDTTGAGDLYAAGLLMGLVRGLPPTQCGQLGALAAAEVISHVGGRPDTSLRELAKQRLQIEL
jgi:sugar/nucleoside kinase (ribokinase family)